MKKRTYILIFFVTAFLLLVTLTIDNILWISKSPEWNSNFTVSNSISSWTGAIKESNIFYQAWYVIGYRIFTVWANWRDLLASVLAGIFVVSLFAVASLLWDKRIHIKF